MKNSIFTVSLDFELMWGVFDQKTIPQYGRNIRAVHDVVPLILDVFKSYDIHATWAIVGFLYCKSINELYEYMPEIRPNYQNTKLSAYEHIKHIPERDFDIYYSGRKLIENIKTTKNQEIGTHTFSHYYCLEPGQNTNEFHADIKQAKKVALMDDISTKSIVFPRNQYKKDYLSICRQEGIIAYRGNEKNYFQHSRPGKKLNYLIRVGRLLDSYVNLTGYNVHSKIEKDASGLVNVAASCFLRPYNSNSILQRLKIYRIKNAMQFAAETGSLFHLWWHPHNFGVNKSGNLAQLKEILDHYKFLNEKYNMQNKTMTEVAEMVIN